MDCKFAALDNHQAKFGLFANIEEEAGLDAP
jgi:hypothetical protein